MKRRTLLLAGGAVVVLGGAYAATRPGTPADPMMAANAQTAAAPAPGTIPDMVMGSADAPIKMMEYASFTCPHCARFHADVWPKLKAEYIDTGKVQFTYREVYFDRFGLWASMIARCGGDMRFFGLAELFYEKQREWTASGDPAEIVAALRKLGKTAGLDDATLDACMNDADQAQALLGWYQANAEADGINSTPSFLIDGEKFSNMSFDALKEILDAKLDG